MRCYAKTKNGYRCKNKALKWKFFCHLHSYKNIEMKDILSIVIKIFSFLATLFTLIISYIQIYDHYNEQGIMKNYQMQGDLNIAVAEFYFLNNYKTKDEIKNLKDLIDDIPKKIADELNLFFTIQNSEMEYEILSPNMTGLISGNSIEKRMENAINRADELKADIIIFGVVEIYDEIWTITPEFYFRDNGTFNISELTGYYDVGSPIEIFEELISPSYKIEISNKIVNRIKLITDLINGLSYYTMYQYENAYGEFISILENYHSYFSNEEDKNSLQMIYLLAGNSASKLKDYNKAEELYLESLELDDQYSRAYIGLADIYYARSIKDVINYRDFSFANKQLLHKSIEYYNLSLTVTNIPPYSDIPTKVNLGLGQCYSILGMSIKDETYLKQAISFLQNVIYEYEANENLRIKIFAGEAHGRLGLIYTYINEKDMAIKEYEQAVFLLRSNVKRLEFYQDTLNELKE